MNIRPDPAAPADLRELTRGEHLVVWALRAFVADCFDHAMVRRGFEDACGARAPEASMAFLVFAQALVLRGRRRICVGAPGRLALTRDEQQIAALFADAQAADRAGFDARLAFLLGRPAEAPFFAAAETTARALAACGRRLRAFGAGRAAGPAAPRPSRDLGLAVVA
ncbi:hypothetical protein [Phenylobacterium sp.]|uniref:hypothetical protein n=1 Tax=Phenylobacterium sp. TaxID=1871053 RepID=UPI0035B114CC